MDGHPSNESRDAIYDPQNPAGGSGFDNPGFDPTHQGRPLGRGFDPYVDSISDSASNDIPFPPPPPPYYVDPSLDQRQQRALRLDSDNKQNPLFLETSEFSTDPPEADDGVDDYLHPSYDPPPPPPPPVDDPLQHPRQLRPSDLRGHHETINGNSDDPLGVLPIRRSLKHPASVSIIGADDRFRVEDALDDRFDEFDRRSSYNFSTPSVSLPSLGKGSLSNPIVVAVSTRHAVDASELHPFEFWSWTKIRRGFIALFVAAFVALLAATIAIIVKEAGGCENTLHWWQGTTFYEISVLSFKDGIRSDGRGDFAGISHELSSIKNLGVKTIRLNSIFARVSEREAEPIIVDYSRIHDRFGSFADFKSLVDDVHKQGLKIVIDFPIFTSQNHNWFRKSRDPNLSIKTRQYYGDFYLWSDIKDGSDGEDWILDSLRGKTFFRHHEPNNQPYLNLASEALRTELVSVFRLWRSSGVDGVIWRGLGKLAHHFHDFNLQKWMRTLDVLKRVFNGQDVEDSLEASRTSESETTTSASRTSSSTSASSSASASDSEGRIFGVDKEFYDEFLKDKKFLPQNLQHDKYFELVLQKISLSTNSTAEMAYQISNIQTQALDPNYPYTLWTLSDEEVSRAASFYGDTFRSALIVLFTLPGSVNIRYGDEVELHDYMGGTHHTTMGIMQWSSGEYGGFSSVSPWLPIGQDHLNVKWNVKDAAKDENSTLNLVKNMAEEKGRNLALRATSFVAKNFDKGTVSRNRTQIVVADEGRFFVIVKKFPRQNSFLLVMNTGNEEDTMDLSALTWMGRLVACTEGYHYDSPGGARGDLITLDSVVLHPKELEFIKLPKSLVINDDVLEVIRNKNNVTSSSIAPLIDSSTDQSTHRH